MLEHMRAKDDAIGFVADIAKQKYAVGVHGVDVGPGRLVRQQRVVMSIQDGDCCGT